MASVTAFEAKTRFGKLLARVTRGEEIVITRHDKPVARMVPEGRTNPSQASAETDALLERVEAGATVVAPALWLLEVANGLLAAQRRKRSGVNML